MAASPPVQITLADLTAQATPTDRGWEASLEGPEEDLDPEVGRRLISELLSGVAQRGGGRLRWRVAAPSDGHREVAKSLGFDDRRRLFQMRRSLPLPWSTDLPTRAFDPDVDTERWLEVNNAAFAWHPEQSGQTADQLAATMAEPWYDPEGFLVHPVEGPMKGFCWTKVHNDFDPPMGEIFVIGVHPDYHGQGLGKDLVLAGLDHMANKGLTRAMLYTEADNIPALRMYEGLGFEVDHEIVVFDLQVESAA